MRTKRTSTSAFPRSAPAVALVAVSVMCLDACSSSTTTRTTSETGGGGSGAVGTTGGSGAAVETGGSTTGGMATGGAATGGAATGGVATGGIATQTGGTATGGSPSGGTATGGIAPTGGDSATGGIDETGGDVGDGGATGGAVGDTGGSSGTGGEATGGAPTTNRSPGCGTPVDAPDPREQQTMNIGGDTRYYLLHVPDDADNETPLMLILGLHGYDMNNVSLAGAYNFTSRSNGQAITVLPQGEGPPPGDVSHWGDGVLNSTWGEGSYPFIEALIADIEDRFCVDPRRVFIVGFSMGGMFTNSIACDHNDWFRGFAPVEGLGPNNCSDASAQSAIMIHQGTGDDLVTPDMGEASRDFWIERNGCTQTSTSSYTGCETYDGCTEGKPVVYCVGSWGHSVESTAVGNIWSFFSSLEVD